MQCGHAWWAPWLHPDSHKVSSMRQVCVLEKGHEGDHRSNTKVTAPNTKEKS